MSNDELDASAARAEAATPGPWELDGHEIYHGHPTSRIVDHVYVGADAAFIAAARADVPILVAEVRRLRAVLQTIADDDPDGSAALARAALDEGRAGR